MMGGRDKVLATAKQAFADGDGQFAAELTQLLVRIDNNDWDARHLKAASLRQRGYQEINTIARAWYLNGANELDGKVNPAGLMQLGMLSVQSRLTGGELLESWRYQVDADKAADSRMVLGFQFTDSGDSYVVELRNSILEINPGPLPADAPGVSLSAQQLRDVLAGKPAPADAGDTAALASLIAYLDMENNGFYMHVR
jgi:alkyl sulfatase BDS1-like metallo-beta-lactamase superfamily hydrolase